MTLSKWTWGWLAAALLLATPTWADTYFGGFEDLAGNSDYDYNDLVFSISGMGLTLNMGADAAWYNAPTTLGDTGNPFWNYTSWDSPPNTYNVGYCIYGGGSCGSGLYPGAQYLASSATPTESANDVTFSTSGDDPTSVVYFHVAADSDELGWYPTTDPSDITWLNTGGTGGPYPIGLTVTTGDSFGLVGENEVTGAVFSSQTNAAVSQFAFFAGAGDPVPEPASIILLGTLGLLIGGLCRRRLRKGEKALR